MLQYFEKIILLQYENRNVFAQMVEKCNTFCSSSADMQSVTNLLIVFIFASKHFVQRKPHVINVWAASSEFHTYRISQSRQNLCCSLIQAASQKEPSDRKPDP